MIEQLHAVNGNRISLEALAFELGVSSRTVGRDVGRLQQSGVPLMVHRGRHGGVSLAAGRLPEPIVFDVSEIAAVMSSLSELGPTTNPSAGSAMRKLAASLDQNDR